MRTHFTALLLLLASWLPVAGIAAIAPPDAARAPSAATLRATHEALREKLAASAFGKPLLLDAGEDRNRVSGEAFAVLEHSFGEASAALSDPAQWCEILLLPFNTKHCTASGGDNTVALTVHVGRKSSTPLESTHRLDFHFDTPARAADYLRVELTAPTGPFGTREYRIVFELVPLDARRAFLHFDYSYAYGALARAAMQAYLNTIGAKKVGFSVDGTDEEGKPALVRGMRGVMERNTMRYYLAIESYLGARKAPQAERPVKMIETWFAAVERYPRQLHEMGREEYVAMKTREYDRMHASAVSPVRRMASSSP